MCSPFPFIKTFVHFLHGIICCVLGFSCFFLALINASYSVVCSCNKCSGISEDSSCPFILCFFSLYFFWPSDGFYLNLLLLFQSLRCRLSILLDLLPSKFGLVSSIGHSSLLILSLNKWVSTSFYRWRNLLWLHCYIFLKVIVLQTILNFCFHGWLEVHKVSN